MVEVKTFYCSAHGRNHTINKNLWKTLRTEDERRFEVAKPPNNFLARDGKQHKCCKALYDEIQAAIIAMAAADKMDLTDDAGPASLPSTSSEPRGDATQDNAEPAKYDPTADALDTYRFIKNQTATFKRAHDLIVRKSATGELKRIAKELESRASDLAAQTTDEHVTRVADDLSQRQGIETEAEIIERHLLEERSATQQQDVHNVAQAFLDQRKKIQEHVAGVRVVVDQLHSSNWDNESERQTIAGLVLHMQKLNASIEELKAENTKIAARLQEEIDAHSKTKVELSALAEKRGRARKLKDPNVPVTGATKRDLLGRLSNFLKAEFGGDDPEASLLNLFVAAWSMAMDALAKKPDSKLHQLIKDHFIKEFNATVPLVLYVKDKYGISNGAYNAIRDLLQQLLLSVAALNKEKESMSKAAAPVLSFGDDIDGVYVDPQERLAKVFAANNVKLDAASETGVSLHIDAMKLTDRRSLCTLSVEVYNLTSRERIVNEVIDFGYVMGDDSHENLTTVLRMVSPAFKRMKTDGIKVTSVDGSTWNVPIAKVFAVLDMKAYCELLGLSGPSSKFPCMFCDKDKKNFSGFDCGESRKGHLHDGDGAVPKDKQNVGVTGSNLLTFIDFDDFVPCTLHAAFRISERLVRMLIRKVDGLDREDKSKAKENRYKDSRAGEYKSKTKGIVASGSGPYVTALHHRLCLIGIKHWAAKRNVSKDFKKLPLNRGECELLAVIDNINVLLEPLQGHEVHPTMLKLFVAWANILPMLISKKQPTEADMDQFDAEVKDFKEALTHSFSMEITPYMHALTCHYGAILRRFRTLALLHNQEAELKHKENRRAYHGMSSHGGGVGGVVGSLKQNLQREQRLTELGPKHEPTLKERHVTKDQVCSHCKNPGHNITTCKKRKRGDKDAAEAAGAEAGSQAPSSAPAPRSPRRSTRAKRARTDA